MTAGDLPALPQRSASERGMAGDSFTEPTAPLMSEFSRITDFFFEPFGAFMDPSSESRFLCSLASSLDLSHFGMIFLAATGLKAGGKKLSFGGAPMDTIVP